MTQHQSYTIEANGSVATISSRGAVVTRWTVPDRSSSVEVIDGYQNQAELDGFDGYRGAILAPWSNRIEDGRYPVGDQWHTITPEENDQLHALHGLVATAEFEVVEHRPDTIVLQTECHHLSGYDTSLRVSVEYHLEQSLHAWDLQLRVNCMNLGSSACPIGLGWHPYINYDGPREQARLVLPARTRVETDERLLPRAGAEAFVPCETFDLNSGTSTIDLSQPWDTAFTDLTLTPGDQPSVTARLEHGSGAITELTAYLSVPVSRGIGVFHVFTGEPLDYRTGESVAIEYCQFMTNAYCALADRDELWVKGLDSRDLRLRLRHLPADAN